MEHPDVYRYATKVVIEEGADGICRWCSQKRGPSSDLARAQARLQKEASDGRQPS
jgi:hypothetical protein